MTERVMPIRFVGGPLNATTRAPRGGRWPSYLTDAGETMSSSRGDRLFMPTLRKGYTPKYTSGYRLIEDRATGQREYVHSSVPGGVVKP